MKRKRWLAVAIAVVALTALASAGVQAQTTVSANSGDWSAPLNWTSGVPANGTWAAINSSHTLNATPGAVVGLLDVGGIQTGNLTIAPSSDLTAVAIRVGQAGG